MFTRLFKELDFSMFKVTKRAALYKFNSSTRKKLKLEKKKLALKRAKATAEKMTKVCNKQSIKIQQLAKEIEKIGNQN